VTAPTRASEIFFEADSHTYWHGMAQVPAVSEIMRPLTQGYLAQIPEDILNWKATLGSAVHRACELLDLDTLDEDELDEQIVPYLEGYKQFLVDHRPEWEQIETIVFDPRAWYAGTLDRAGVLNGAPVVCDLKTSAVVASYAGIQLWAYAAAADTYASLTPPDLVVLQLRKGDYRLHRFDDQHEYKRAWEALLEMHRWKARHDH